MIKIVVHPEFGQAWLTLQGPNNEKEFVSEMYANLSNARRAAKKWQSRIPGSVIYDKKKQSLR